MSISADLAPTRTAAHRIAGGAADLPIAGTHIAALDGIRGAAILLVLWYHFSRSAVGFGFEHSSLRLGAIGWVGVDLFFVLSGFLITGILHDSRSTPRFFRNFYARRALRIFPLYYGALFLVVVLALVWPTAGIWGTHSPAWIGLYLTNILIALDGPAAAGLLAHFWSLAIEEHFYLVWPLLVFWTTRRQLMLLAAVIILVSPLLRAALLLKGMAPEAIYMLTPTRIDALAMGALCSLLIRSPHGVRNLVVPAWGSLVCGGAALAGVILAERSLGNDGFLIQTFGYSLLAICFGGLIVAAVTTPILSAIAANGVLRWFGRYSYGLYVWHPIIAVILFYSPLSAWFGVQPGSASAAALIFGALMLSIAVSVASFHFWEKPFLTLKHRFE